MTAPAALTLRSVRRLLEGAIPPAMCSVSASGQPHVKFLLHAEYVDDHHVALTSQMAGRSHDNLLATQRVALSVEDPMGGAGVMLRLHYLRTDTEGPVLERLRAKLSAIASHAGMGKIFRLRAVDIFRVEGVESMDPRHEPRTPAARCDLAAGVRRLGQALAEAGDTADLLRVLMNGLKHDLQIDHAILWMLDEAQQGLFSLGSLGYPDPGTGAEMPLAEAGLVGVAVRERVPVRIGHLCAMYDYALSSRERALQLGLDAVVQPRIPLPGLPQPRSQLAVPLRARGRNVGALLVESERDQFFSYDDEDALAAVGAALALGLATLPAADLADVPPQPAAVGQNTPAGTAALCVRHHPRDHSVFVNDQYLIKGVAGAVVAKLVRDQIASGRDAFSTRELRLAAAELGLPDVQDNLGVRLLMLERRLAERDFGLRIERSGRGLYRLVASGPLVMATGT